MKAKEIIDKLKFKGKYGFLLNTLYVVGVLVSLVLGFSLMFKGVDGVLGVFTLLIGLFVVLIVFTFVLLALFAASETEPAVDVKESLKLLITHHETYNLSKAQVKNAKNLLKRIVDNEHLWN